MKNKRGFILLEAFIMFLLLSIAFLHIYRTASFSIQRDRATFLHDDIAILFKGHYVQEILFQYTNVGTWNQATINQMMNNPETYGRIIGQSTPNFFRNNINANQINDFNTIIQRLNLGQIFITNNMVGLRECARRMTGPRCGRTFMDEELRSFIMTINLGDYFNPNSNFLIISFRRNQLGGTCGVNDCFTHFTWVKIPTQNA